MLHTMTVAGGQAPVVFLHGLFGQGKNFLSIAKAVQDVATSTMVDLPNHGRSPWTEVIDYPTMAAQVAELVETLDGPVNLVGHSMGGKVAMRLALDHPELVRRLMVVDVSPVQGLATNFDPFYEAMCSLDLANLTSRKQADEYLSAGIPDPVVRGFLMQNLRHEDHAWRWQMNLELLRSSMPAISGWQEVEARYAGPVMWVRGERSGYVRTEYQPTMKALFPRVLMVTIKDSGHWVHSEQPQRFISTLRSFLQLSSD